MSRERQAKIAHGNCGAGTDCPNYDAATDDGIYSGYCSVDCAIADYKWETNDAGQNMPSFAEWLPKQSIAGRRGWTVSTNPQS